MDKKIIISVLAVVAVGGILFAAFGHGGVGQMAASGGGSTTAAQSGSAGNSTQLFANSQYAPYAYLISQPPLSQQTNAALAGFKVSSIQLANGSTQMTLSVNGSNANQTVTLGKGYKMYFIETTFGDDTFGHESSLGDDGYIVVNPAGYVV